MLRYSYGIYPPVITGQIHSFAATRRIAGVHSGNKSASDQSAPLYPT
jgi:hypothetical protein